MFWQKSYRLEWHLIIWHYLNLYVYSISFIARHFLLWKLTGAKFNFESMLHEQLYITGNGSHIFSSEHFSTTGYYIGVCHGWFHLHGLTRHVSSADWKLHNEKFLHTLGFGPFANEYSLSVALLVELSIEYLVLNIDHILPECAIKLYLCWVPRGRCSKLFYRVLHLINSSKQQNDTNIILQKYKKNHFAISTAWYR